MNQKEILSKILEFLESIGVQRDRYSIKLSKKKSKQSPKKKLSPNGNTFREKHPWRLCPFGQHWENRHNRKQGKSLADVDGHCVDNPSREDILTTKEIKLIVEQHFPGLGLKVSKKKLRKKVSRKINGKIREELLAEPEHQDDFDHLIEGWTRYWNEVLKPGELLDPNLVKALIFSESSFNNQSKAKIKKTNSAHGLMQITTQTITLLKKHRGEVKDHLVILDLKEAYDPAVNICAGIRWMFHKKYLLEKNKPQISWLASIWYYKSYGDKFENDPTKPPKGMENVLFAFDLLVNK